MFQSILSTLVARTGARWAMIAGTDGVLLETNSEDFRAEAEGLAAEYATLYRASRKVASDTAMGALKSSVLVTDQGKTVFQTLTADYFLILALEAESYVGKTFYEISRASGTLEEELVY
jgi:predicted regulator of Ras-like GTPase activity (Roadblock/LC7/MglB family)